MKSGSCAFRAGIWLLKDRQVKFRRRILVLEASGPSVPAAVITGSGKGFMAQDQGQGFSKRGGWKDSSLCYVISKYDKCVLLIIDKYYQAFYLHPATIHFC